MPSSATSAEPGFAPTSFQTFRFLERSLDGDGLVRLRYGLDERHVFEERFQLPDDAPRGGAADPIAIDHLLGLLHWAAGVSYYKLAIPPAVSCETGLPGPAGRRLLEALYSEGLGEFAVVNGLPDLPRPRFPEHGVDASPAPAPPQRVLVPVGGGKDSAVAIEIVRATGLEFGLFSVGDATPIARTARAADAPRLRVTRTLDPQVIELNRLGALNGHVPITAIVSLVAALTAALNGYDAVALANERSASAGNTMLGEVEVNHQFSKSWRAEQLLAAAVAETGVGVSTFSVLRPASELSIARTFSRLTRYHDAFTSCNRIFRLDPALRATSWCADCDKCRFVFLILAPFLDREAMTRIFGRSMLDDPAQRDGFARLAGIGGHKPFECVGEVEEAVAAIRLLAEDREWSSAPVVRGLVESVLPRFGPQAGRPEAVFALSAEHAVPERMIDAVDALLGA